MDKGKACEVSWETKAIEVRMLEKSFGGLKAVCEMDLDLEEGEITSVIGPNGAGKTTLLNLICGYLRPDAGDVKILGRSATGMPAEKITRFGVGRTFQQPKVFSRLTAYENLMVAALNLSKSGDKKKRVDEHIAMFNLESVRDSESRTLSFGQQRLLEIARTLLTEPKVWVFDEPTAGVHIALVKKLEEIVREQSSSGKAVLIVEHNMRFVATVSDRVVVMSNGRKIVEGRYEEIRRNKEVIESYLGVR